jgi:DNA-directed RNA polymerase subunit RPC12/RpoP
MDISFKCDHCGKKLAIDDAAAGITIDCPDCGKAVYVPSSAPAPKPKDPPARVEPKPLTRVATPAPARVPMQSPPARASVPRPRSNPLLPPSTPNPRPAVHPSIAAGVHCLVILVAMGFLAFILTRQNILLIYSVLMPCIVFGSAAFWCAVYGMCIGHVRHGLLVLAGLALILSLSWWVADSMATAMTVEAQRQGQKMFQQQMKDFQKAFPLLTPHP